MLTVLLRILRILVAVLAALVLSSAIGRRWKTSVPWMPRLVMSATPRSAPGGTSPAPQLAGLVAGSQQVVIPASHRSLSTGILLLIPLTWILAEALSRRRNSRAVTPQKVLTKA